MDCCAEPQIPQPCLHLTAQELSQRGLQIRTLSPAPRPGRKPWELWRRSAGWPCKAQDQVTGVCICPFILCIICKLLGW